jgi:anaerobic magnesium-protoporphyrin IX monomethyl ester cyclase
MQARPKALARVLWHGDADFRHAMRWYTRIGRRVWFHEVAEFIFSSRLLKHGPTLREFLGPTLAQREYVLDKRRPALNSERVIARGR